VDVVHISDADKGAAACYAKNLEFAQAVICREHRGDTCGGKFGKGAKYLYENYANATTPAQQRRALSKMTLQMRAYVTKLPAAMQCKLSHPGKLHAVLTSNQAESENNAVQEVRECHLVYSVTSVLY
jgi:hypothetical protein